MTTYGHVQLYNPYSPSNQTPSLPCATLMPSVDLCSPLTPRRAHSTYSAPLLDGWDVPLVPLPPPTIYTTPSSPRSHAARRQCSPYGSPSNPFRYRPNAYLSPSDIHTGSRVNLHKAIQRITGISKSTPAPTPISVGWKEHTETDWSEACRTVLRVVFWAAVVVYFSALLGVGASGQQEGITTRVWNRHIPEPSGLNKIGWKGVGMVDRGEEMKRGMKMGRGMQGIWE